MLIRLNSRTTIRMTFRIKPGCKGQTPCMDFMHQTSTCNITVVHVGNFFKVSFWYLWLSISSANQEGTWNSGFSDVSMT